MSEYITFKQEESYRGNKVASREAEALISKFKHRGEIVLGRY